MKKEKKIKYRVIELDTPKGGRRGKINYNGMEPEPHEKRTIRGFLI